MTRDGPMTAVISHDLIGAQSTRQPRREIRAGRPVSLGALLDGVCCIDLVGAPLPWISRVC